MQRREFIKIIGGTAALWTAGARAQERGGVPKVGVILTYSEADPEGQTRLSALRKRLQQHGWM